MKNLLFLLAIISFASCQKTPATSEKCDHLVTMSKQKYNNASSSSFSISEVEIIGDCINITVTASGCSGDTWTAELIDSKAIAESLPEQKYFKLRLSNTEICLAIVSKTFSFDLTPSKIGRDFSINLDAWDGLILFEE